MYSCGFVGYHDCASYGVVYCDALHEWGVALCVFFDGPATTEIYTYGHTLSLHDALPIHPRERHLGRPDAHAGGLGHRRCPLRVRLEPRPRDRKSTRELQSLMRISYAVVCLIKKSTSRAKTAEERRKHRWPTEQNHHDILRSLCNKNTFRPPQTARN